MSDFLLEAILTHHNKQVKQSEGFIYASTDNKEWVNVTGYSLIQLKTYLDNN